MKTTLYIKIEIPEGKELIGIILYDHEGFITEAYGTISDIKMYITAPMEELLYDLFDIYPVYKGYLVTVSTNSRLLGGSS